MPIDSNTLQMRKSSKASRPRRSARTTQILGEAAGAGVTRKSAASRSLFQGDGSRDAVVLVMLEDQNISARNPDGGRERRAGLGQYGGHAVHRKLTRA